MLDRYAVVGTPIQHSLSPRIHRLFAEQSNQQLSYQAIEFDGPDFETRLQELRGQGFRGVNVTLPFKQQAWLLCDTTAQRAERAGAVNTLSFRDDGRIAGDNTDGAGLIRDLVVNWRVPVANRRLLIMGAGGAVRGVLAPLLELKPATVTLVNRTLEKARLLAKDFADLGTITACAYDQLGEQDFDLIINGTAAGIDGAIPPIPDQILTNQSICYDMMYNISQPTAFVKWAQQRGALIAVDGLGMLVEQAAESFFIWRGVKVNAAKVIDELRRHTPKG